MKDYIEERAIDIANYIIENNTTVRQTAKQFGISKSTVHKDVTERLMQINPTLATEARKVLDVNKSERHIRGGLATKDKYNFALILFYFSQWPTDKEEFPQYNRTLQKLQSEQDL